jgi:hypothetical protein
MSDGGVKIIQAVLDEWKSMSKDERRLAIREAIAKTTEIQRVRKERCATHDHPPRYDDVFFDAVRSIWRDPLDDSNEGEAMSERGPWPHEGNWSVFAEKVVAERDTLERLCFDLQAAAWDVVLELSDARREMGLDFPDELAATYERCGKLEEALLALKEKTRE